LILVTGNARIDTDAETAIKRIRRVFDTATDEPIAPRIAETDMKFPYLPEPESPGRIINQERIADLDIECIDFANGLRLNLKQTDFKKNAVRAVLIFGDGRRSEPDPGMALTAQSVLNRSGLGTLTRTQLDRALAGRKTRAGFHVKEDAFSISGRTVSDEVLLLMQLMYATLLDPGYRETAHGLVMKEFRQTHEEMTQSIEGAMNLYGERFLAGGDTRFGHPSLVDIERITLDDIQKWIDPARGRRLELTVVGDFDPETVKTLAARYFGTLPAMAETVPSRESLSFPAGKALDVPVQTVVDKGMLVVVWPTMAWGQDNINRVRTLNIMSRVFSDRMRVEIREKLGATYSQYAYNLSSRTYDYGAFRTIMITDPEQAAPLIDVVKGIAADLSENGPTPNELKRAMEPVLTSIRDMVRTNGYWLNRVMAGSLRYPEQLDWARTVQTGYAKISLDDVGDAAKTYFQNSMPATVIVRPASGS